MTRAGHDKLTAEQELELHHWAAGGDCPYWLCDWAVEYYCDVMPYTTMNGDESTPDEWLADRVEEVMDHFGLEVGAA